AMRGPVTDDDLYDNDEATYGPVSAEYLPVSDGAMGSPPDGTMPGPGTVELNVEGGGLKPPPSTPSVSVNNTDSLDMSSKSGSDARAKRASHDPLYVPKKAIKIPGRGHCWIRSVHDFGDGLVRLTIRDSE